MPRLFGTDGIRGRANVDLKPTVAYALGRATASHLLGGEGRILVGQDTRRSGDMLVAAIVAGATSMGVDAHRMGVCPTPALAYATGALGYGAGIMVSASHNPAEDNGLKVLGPGGGKLDDQVEDELEALIWRTDELAGPTNDRLGRLADSPAAIERYREHRLGLAARTRTELRVVVDCANGSASAIAGDIIGATGAEVAVRFAEPDGVNINLGCGATAPGALAAMVAAEDAHVGFALDGDADRCVAVDEHGDVVDGDQLLGIIALDRLERGRLTANTLVVSVLSNGGLADAVHRAGGRVVRTPVGDKHIADAMAVSGAGVGGEKSGHVIIAEHTATGDGIVTALEVLDILARCGRSLSELAARVPLYPQEQRAIHVRHKEQWAADLQLADAIAAAEAELTAAGGRIVVRPSGTEPALRIMVEGPDAVRVRDIADTLAALTAQRLN
ncbi:MAG: phosphoglucosamine mutase [Chloroflexota bacterium]